MSTTNDSWPPAEVTTSLFDLEELYNLVSDNFVKRINIDEVDIGGRYLVIRSCGHIEVTTSECLVAFLQRHADQSVNDYIRNSYRTWQSPNHDNLKRAMKRINRNLPEPLIAFLRTDYEGENYDYWLKALTDARNSIAHGANTPITTEDSLKYCRVATNLSQWYVDFFKPLGDADAILGYSAPEG